MIRPDPKNSTGGYWRTISSERQQLEEEIASYAVEFKRTNSEIGELITEVTGVAIDSDDDDLDARSLVTDEQLKAVVDKFRQNEEPRSYKDDPQRWEFDLDAINEASAEAARLQGEYWDALRDLEESIGLDIDSPGEFCDVTFVSIAQARAHYRHWEEKATN